MTRFAAQSVRAFSLTISQPKIKPIPLIIFCVKNKNGGEWFHCQVLNILWRHFYGLLKYRPWKNLVDLLSTFTHTQNPRVFLFLIGCSPTQLRREKPWGRGWQYVTTDESKLFQCGNTVNSLASDHPWFTKKWSLTRGGRLREQSTK